MARLQLPLAGVSCEPFASRCSACACVFVCECVCVCVCSVRVVALGSQATGLWLHGPRSQALGRGRGRCAQGIVRGRVGLLVSFNAQISPVDFYR